MLVNIIIFNLYFLILVLALLANKDDLLEKGEVNVKEGEDLAKEINAIFQRTSAKNATGIEDLFNLIGKKYVEKKGLFIEEKDENKSTKLSQNIKTKKKKCC